MHTNAKCNTNAISNLGNYGQERSKIHQNFVSVKEISEIYQISKSSLYELIKSDPKFPAVNMGVKKRFFINPKEFESWFRKRSEDKLCRTLRIPTVEDLRRIK